MSQINFARINLVNIFVVVPKRKRAAYAEHFLLYGRAPSSENELDDGPSQKKRTRQSEPQPEHAEPSQISMIQSEQINEPPENPEV